MRSVVCMRETQDTTSAGVGMLPRVLSACAAVDNGTSTGAGGGAHGDANLT